MMDGVSRALKGFVEALTEHEVRGWVFDETDPDAHLPVSAWLDGMRVGSGTAGVQRPDLRSARIGNGDHGFCIAFERALQPGSITRLELRAEHGGRSIHLKPLPDIKTNRSLVDGASDASAPFIDTNRKPVFILGAARSGTSALALALLKSGRYQGHGEGHLLPLAQRMLGVVDGYYRDNSGLEQADTLLRMVHQEAFQRSVRRSFVQLLRATYPNKDWIDKTPTAAMVRAAPLMQEIWPNARFIFMKRRVIENIISRRRKFPQDTLQNHYLDWVDVLSAWQGVRDRLGSAAMEAEQLRMARDNDAFSTGIAAFLSLTEAQAEGFRRALASDHPEQTADKIGVSNSMQDLGLRPDEELELRTACDPIMQAYSYSYDGTYHRL